MTKEIYHQGWLIKSPPTKRIWRARWRKRWFTLKQGEIPQQFCLEYYTHPNCQKLKGVIDLDQCEQVDSGLQLEHRKQKFQYMFDVKTPHRTYYLAADTEDEMNAWVNCICELCNLQDLSKPQQPNNAEYKNYFNCIAEGGDQAAASTSLDTSLKTSTTPTARNVDAPDQVSLLKTEEPIDNNNSVYENFGISYNNRATVVCDMPLNRQPIEPKENYYNFDAIVDALTARRPTPISTAPNLNKENVSLFGERRAIGNHQPQRKIPENLNLGNNMKMESTASASSSSSTSTGPYIEISKCKTGYPLIDRENPMTPLNSLDPRFYETPRNHAVSGLNLTNDQPYSPKRNNIPTSAIAYQRHQQLQHQLQQQTKQMSQSQEPLQQQPQEAHSGLSSPTDSGSVFTDDDESITPHLNESSNGDRSMRPSESSIENDSIVFTYSQRFSKAPAADADLLPKPNDIKRPNPLLGVSLEKPDIEHSREAHSSDTENASPAIAFGPKDSSSIPYIKTNEDIEGASNHKIVNHQAQNTDGCLSAGVVFTEMSDDNSTAKPSKHFYTNAAPTLVEGNVFRYDFDDKSTPAPAVDRNLKPKHYNDENDAKNLGPMRTPRSLSLSLGSSSASRTLSTDLRPPSIDRNLKPIPPMKHETSTLQRKGIIPPSSTEIEFQTCHNADEISKTLPRNYNPMSSPQNIGGNRAAGVLEYFDLDHSNPPPICYNASTSASTSNLSMQSGNLGNTFPTNLSNRFSTLGISSFSIGTSNKLHEPMSSSISMASSIASGSIPIQPVSSGIVYKSVDFIKTEAFMRTRQDAEMARAKNRSKE